MDWTDTSGLAAGLREMLSDQEASRLAVEFDGYAAEWYGHRVPRAGQHIWRALNDETSFSSSATAHFQRALADLLRAALTDRSLAIACNCAFHQGLFDLYLRGALLRKERNWLATLLQLVSVHCPDLHAQLVCPDDVTTTDAKPHNLSRFMPLTRFIECHLTTTLSDAACTRLLALLSPSLHRDARMISLKTDRECGTLKGRLGTYPHVKGLDTKNEEWCEHLRPFATLTPAVDALVEDRIRSPDRVLQLLGVPFRAGQYWIELQYAAAAAAIFRPSERRFRLSIPTAIDAAGNWAFRPDRNNPPRWNHARDLLARKRGLPEVIHQPLDCDRINDAIVWPEPAARDWPVPESPYLME